LWAQGHGGDSDAVTGHHPTDRPFADWIDGPAQQQVVDAVALVSYGVSYKAQVSYYVMIVRDG